MTDKNFDLEKLAELYPDAAKELLSYTQALDSKLLQKEGGDDFITYIKHMLCVVIAIFIYPIKCYDTFSSLT